MTYYYFTTAEYGLDNLRKRRLKISDIRALNDPFEFMSADLSNKQNRRALDLVKDKIGSRTGLLCFSRNWQNPVQWSHYSNRHRGICLGFEIPGELLAQVSYVNSRTPWPKVVDKSFFDKIIRTKFSHWSYEDEFRMFCSMQDEENGNFFYYFQGKIELTKVIVGHCSDVKRGDISNALGDLAPGVEAFKARAAFQSFRVVRQKNERLWS